MTKPRDYTEEYARFHGKPAEIAKRAKRNSARAEMVKSHGKRRSPARMSTTRRRSATAAATGRATSLSVRFIGTGVGRRSVEAA